MFLTLVGCLDVQNANLQTKVGRLQTYVLPSSAVCANFAHTRSAISSSESKMFFRCLVITLLSTSNNVAIAFCVAQTVSSLYSTCMPSSLPVVTNVRNSAVLFLISNFFVIVCIVVTTCKYSEMLYHIITPLPQNLKREDTLRRTKNATQRK